VNPASALPNRHRAPLTADERLAERYLQRPELLLDLAAATGNRGLYGIARDLLRKPARKRVCNLGNT